MKRFVVTIIAVLFSCALAAQNAEAIRGTYYSHDKIAKVNVYFDGKLWQGKLVWSDKYGDSVKDKNIFVFRDLKYSDNKWSGKIFDPRNGHEYNLEVNTADAKGLMLTVRAGVLKKNFQWSRAL